jgi:hypothetical protein
VKPLLKHVAEDETEWRGDPHASKVSLFLIILSGTEVVAKNLVSMTLSALDHTHFVFE